MKFCTKGLLYLFLLLAPVSMLFSQNCAPVGWASQNGGTTGGGNATPITVSTLTDLQTQAKSAGAKVILVSGKLGTGVSTRVQISADKTIIGLPGATLFGGFDIKASNIIVKNMIVKGPGSVDVNGVDCFTIQNATNVWIDHCDISDGQDGNLDIVNASNFVSVTWCKFSYTSASANHQFCNLLGNSDSKTTDRGKLKITMMNNWWTAGCKERMPRVRFGQVHVVNNLFDSKVADYCVRAGLEADILVESNYFDGVKTPIDLYENNFTAVTSKNNFSSSTTTGNSLGSGTSFTPSYSLNIAAAESVKNLVSNPTCGAGATLASVTSCGCGSTPPPPPPPSSFTLNTTTAPAGAGTITRSPNASSYAAGTVVTLTATAAAGYTFNGWSGATSAVNATTTITINANTVVTANFIASNTTTFALTTTATPAAGGTITRSPNASSYAAGTVVTLNATAAAGYTFTGWSGAASGSNATTTVIMSAAKAVTANFTVTTGGTVATLRINDKSGTGVGYCSAEGSRQSSYAGADGGYYVNLSNSSAKGITWSVKAATAGTYSLKWRYANAGSSSATAARVLVNGAQAIASVAFPKTSAWTTWTTTASVTVTLVAGTNKIRLETIQAAEFANIDWIEITGNNPTEALCSAVIGSTKAETIATAEKNERFVVSPNPSVNKNCTVRFFTENKQQVSIRLFSIDGRSVKNVTNATFDAGPNTVTIDCSNLKPATYFIVINANGSKTTKHIVVQ